MCILTESPWQASSAPRTLPNPREFPYLSDSTQTFRITDTSQVGSILGMKQESSSEHLSLKWSPPNKCNAERPCRLHTRLCLISKNFGSTYIPNVVKTANKSTKFITPVLSVSPKYPRGPLRTSSYGTCSIQDKVERLVPEPVLPLPNSRTQRQVQYQRRGVDHPQRLQRWF